MKILILSCNVGSGYNMAVWALYEEFRVRGVNCDFLDIFSFVPEKERPRILKKARSLYASLSSHLVSPSETASGRRPAPSRALAKLNRTYQSALKVYLQEHLPDLVLTPHLFAAAALSDLRKQLAFPCETIGLVTDFALIRAWGQIDLDHLILASRDLMRSCTKVGVPRLGIFPLGVPLPRTFGTSCSIEEARSLLNLPTDGKLILVSGTTLSISELRRLLAPLRHDYGSRLSLVVLTDSRTPNLPDYERAFRSDDRFFVRSDVESISRYMDAAQILIARPTGLIAVESAAKRLPTLLVHPATALEKRSADYLQRRQAARFLRKKKELLEGIRDFLDHPQAAEEMRSHQAVLVPTHHAGDICSFILSVAPDPQSASATEHTSL